MPSEDIERDPRPICACGEEILTEYWEEGELIRVHVGGNCTLVPKESSRTIPPQGSRFGRGGIR